MTETTTDKIRHRIRSHRAALQIAHALGPPARAHLARAVVETRARIDEAEQILAIVEEQGEPS